MRYQISKYDAIKILLQAEENSSYKLAAKILHIIQHAMNNEIKSKKYSNVYIITESEKKYFKKVSPECIISILREDIEKGHS